jgi:hypothetical protein
MSVGRLPHSLWIRRFGSHLTVRYTIVWPPDQLLFRHYLCKYTKVVATSLRLATMNLQGDEDEGIHPSL